MSEDVFDRTWRACAQRGWCDNLGGCEYQRVRGEWAASPTPIGNLHEFIRRRANIGPDGVEPCYGSGVKKESAWTTDLDEVFEETIKSETSATPVLWSSAVVGAVLQTTVEWGSAGGRRVTRVDVTLHELTAARYPGDVVHTIAQKHRVALNPPDQIN